MTHAALFTGNTGLDLAAARTNNGRGIAGVCPNCRILPLRVSRKGELARDVDIAAAIRYAADMQEVRVINLSLGDGCTAELAEAVNYAYVRGKTLVAASGNVCPASVALGEESFEITFPARFGRVIAVGASDKSDNRASFSCYGAELDLVAPGVDIWSTDLGGGYRSVSRTSFASPMVAGVAGLLLSQNPSLTPAQVQAVLERSADDLGSTGRDDQTGWGRINAARAVQTTVGAVSPAPPVTCAHSSSGKSVVLEPGEDDLISMYTQFRDEVLVTSKLGRDYVSLYYEYGPELASILLTNSELRVRTAQFLSNASAAFGSLLPSSTTEVTLSQALYDEGHALVHDLAAAGSQGFQNEMHQVWANMRLEQQVGETATSIWEEMQRSSVYLPIVAR